MLTKLHVLVSKNADALWEARILEADFLTRAKGTTLTELLKELYNLIGAHLDACSILGQEPFGVDRVPPEIKAEFEVTHSSLEWLNPPSWADRLPILEIRCAG